MNNHIKNTAKVLFLGGLIGASYLYGKSRKNETIEQMIKTDKTAVSKSISSGLTLKLPDGSIKIEYEKMTDGPFKTFGKLGSFAPHTSAGDPVDATFWVSREFRPWGGAANLEANFFQLSYGEDRQVYSDDKLNNDDGIPQIFIVPKYKEIRNKKKNFSEQENNLKHMWEYEDMNGFFSTIFVDRDFMERVKSPKLYHLDYIIKRLSFIKDMNFKKEGDVFVETLDTEKLLTKFHTNYYDGYCPVKEFRELGMDSIPASSYPVLVIGDFEDKPEYKNSKDKSKFFTIFGLYDPKWKNLEID